MKCMHCAGTGELFDRVLNDWAPWPAKCLHCGGCGECCCADCDIYGIYGEGQGE